MHNFNLDDCNNGEKHYYNYRNVTFEYLLLKRFDIRIIDLDDKEKMDTLVDNGDLYHYYPLLPAKYITKS